MPRVVRGFIRRTTDSNQGLLTYEKARRFYSNASSRLSAEKVQRLAPQAKRPLSQFTSDLGDAKPRRPRIRQDVCRTILDAMSGYPSAARPGSWGEAAQEAGKDLLRLHGLA